MQKIKPISFKSVSKLTCIFLVAAFLAACSSEQSPQTANNSSVEKFEKITLRLAHGWPKGFPYFGESVDDYAKLVNEMSDGRIEIKVDSANKHKAAFGIFDFIKSGQYDIGQTASYYYGGKDPDTLFFTSMPFSMTKEEQTAWFYEGGGLELANEVYAKHGIEVMLGGNTDMQMGGWFRKEINSVEDLQGLKMRIPGFGGKVIAGVGVVPTNIPAGELYQALDLGTIDALEWVAPGLDLRMVTAYNMSTALFDANAQNWDVISSKYPNVQIKQFPESVIQALKESNRKLIESENARSQIAKKIIESREQYMNKARAWTEIGQKLYLDAN